MRHDTVLIWIVYFQTFVITTYELMTSLHWFFLAQEMSGLVCSLLTHTHITVRKWLNTINAEICRQKKTVTGKVLQLYIRLYTYNIYKKTIYIQRYVTIIWSNKILVKIKSAFDNEYPNNN